MKFTTSKIDDHTSRIRVNGKTTDFVISKGDDPKWGDHREWHVGLLTDHREGPWMTVYRRKSDALAAFAEIYRAGHGAAKLEQATAHDLNDLATEAPGNDERIEDG